MRTRTISAPIGADDGRIGSNDLVWSLDVDPARAARSPYDYPRAPLSPGAASSCAAGTILMARARNRSPRARERILISLPGFRPIAAVSWARSQREDPGAMEGVVALLREMSARDPEERCRIAAIDALGALHRPEHAERARRLIGWLFPDPQS